MDKKQIKARVIELLAAGTGKAEVFAQLSGQGVKDSQLAYFIAAYVAPHRCHEHDRKVNVAITIMFFQAVIALLIGFGIGSAIGPNAKWIMAALFGIIPLLFAWGFYTHRVGAYNAYILLSLIQAPKLFDGFTTNPVSTSIGAAIGIGVLAYIWFVREKLFPDFAFITPRKVKGQYVFAG